ncbi:MAG: permease-like cell division protein FtsX [Bacteroidales bacterium]|nr:permease-like cell division protein FtsX [Bacteroidales bacterium]
MARKEKTIINRRLVQSYLSSTISISLVLYLVGIACFVGFNAKGVSNYFKENTVVSVILKSGTTEEKALQFEKELSEKEFVKTAEYISKERGYQEMKDLLGDNFLDVFEVNPIPISIDLNLNAEYCSSDSLAMIKESLSKMSLVKEVTYQESLVEMLNANLNKIGIVMSIAIILLLFISFVLIGNTVRLNVYAKRFTIHTMRLVGAKKNFIRKPFVKQAAMQGVVAALVAIILLGATLLYAKKHASAIFAMFDSSLLLVIFAVVMLVGILICMIAAWYVVGKVAYLSKDDLYY